MHSQFNHARLANGLTVIGEIREQALSCACGFFVKTGSRDETARISGVSHFLEHMMFKGTDKRSALQLSFDLGAIGAQANAYTSSESTVYYAAVLPEYFSAALEILSDMLRPALDEKEFNVEKGVILEEIALYKDRPAHVLFETALSKFFSGHPAGNSVLGTTESVGGLSREAMLAYFQQRYSPSNIILVASGNFNWQQLLELANHYCGHWADYPCSRDYPICAPDLSFCALTKPDINKGYACLICPGPSAQDEISTAGSVLSCILGDCSGSKTYWNLIDKGLADSASIDLDEMDRVGIVYGFVSSEPEGLDRAVDVVKGIMSKPLDFKDDELDRAKTKLSTRLVLQGESSLRRLHHLGTDWVYRGKYESLEDKHARIQSINRLEIEEFVQAHSLDNPKVINMKPQ